MENYYQILFGWLLGALSPLILTTIANRFRRVEIRRGILTELADIQFRMRAVSFKLLERSTPVTKEHLEEIVEHLSKSASAERAREMAEMLDQIDNETAALLDQHGKATMATGLNLKKYRASYLDANFSHLGVFSESERKLLMEIRSVLEFYNEDVEEARAFHKMSFQIEDAGNHKIACDNLDGLYVTLGTRAREIADMIQPLVGKEKGLAKL